jgi:tetratricopeptide (TPR) repeat protein
MITRKKLPASNKNLPKYNKTLPNYNKKISVDRNRSFIGRMGKAITYLFVFAALFLVIGFVASLFLRYQKPNKKTDLISHTKKQHLEMLVVQENRVIEQLHLSNSYKKSRMLEKKLYTIHRKIANLEKSHREEVERRRSADEALRKLNKKLPASQIEYARIKLREGNLEYAERAFDYIANRRSGPVAVAFFQSGQMAESRLDYVKAMQQYRKALELARDNPEYLAKAGRMATQVGNHGQAQEWLKRLLKIREVESRQDPKWYQRFLFRQEETKKEMNLANAQILLALLFQKRGKGFNGLRDAQYLFKRAHWVMKNALGREHPLVLETLNNLAISYKKDYKFEKAIPLFKETISLMENTWGENHPLVAEPLYNLAWIYQHKRELKKAEPLFLRALSIMEQSRCKTHLYMTEILRDSGWLYISQGQYKKSQNLYKKALTIKEKIFGKNHHAVKLPLRDVAVSYEFGGEYEKSEPFRERILLIGEKQFGKDGPSLISDLGELVNVYRQQEKTGKAEQLLKRILSIKIKKYGNEHFELASTLNYLGIINLEKGRYQEAELLLKRALSIMEKKYGKEHHKLLHTLSHLAEAYQKQGKDQEAEPFRNRALSIKEASQ